MKKRSLEEESGENGSARRRNGDEAQTEDSRKENGNRDSINHPHHSNKDEDGNRDNDNNNNSNNKSMKKSRNSSENRLDDFSKSAGRQCPYLDTIDKSKLDFDFEKLCSVTLSNANVYACLVCGKYFQGRGSSTPAYFHSLQSGGHHVFLNLKTSRAYCLPDSYEIVNEPSLNDIIDNLNPKYSLEQIKALDSNTR